MARLVDNAGRTWTVTIHVPALERMAEIAGLAVVGPHAADDLMRIYNDPIALVRGLYAICKPEADEKGVSLEDFMGAFG